jgi:hypothetical protein
MTKGDNFLITWRNYAKATRLHISVYGTSKNYVKYIFLNNFFMITI